MSVEDSERAAMLHAIPARPGESPASVVNGKIGAYRLFIEEDELCRAMLAAD